MGNIKSRVMEIVRQEQRHLHTPSGLASLAMSAVGMAAGRASTETQTIVEEGRSLSGIARMLGVSIRAGFPDSSHRPSYHAKVSSEEREKFGYGELPDALIIDVNQVIGGVMPEFESPDPAKVLAARTMQTVLDRPTITAHDLREKLSQQNAQFGLPMQQRPQLPATVVALDGVITITHFMTTQYVEHLIEQETVTLQQVHA